MGLYTMRSPIVVVSLADCVCVCYSMQGCYINPYGRCMALATAKFDATTLDFRKANASNNYTSATYPSSLKHQKPLYFPAASGVKYCNATDPICKECRKEAFADVIDKQTNDSSSRFCYGRNKCVCVAICESPMRTELLGGLMCNGKPQYGPAGSSNQASSPENSSFLDVDANITWLVGVPMVGIIAAVLFVSRRRKQRRLTRDTEDIFNFEGARPSSPISDSSESFSSSSSSEISSIDGGVPHATAASVASADATTGGGGRQLSLVGWHALRNELIGREQQMLAGGQTFSSIGYVEFLDTSASAPSEEDEDSSSEGEDEDDQIMSEEFVDVESSSSSTRRVRSTTRGARRRDPLFGIEMEDDDDIGVL